MYNAHMADNDMLDTSYLFQPRGPGTAWHFRMPTPEVLIGRTNPRTGRPYGREVREGLGGERELRKARKLRDLRLGAVRAEEALALAETNGSLEQALTISQELRRIEDPTTREAVQTAISNQAEKLETRIGERKAVTWYKVATGERTPFKEACDRYKEDAGKALSTSTLNNLNTAINEFMEFAGKDACLEEINRRKVAEFVTKFLPNRKSPRAPNGQGPATIRKKVSQLSQVWAWAKKRGLLTWEHPDPWEEQAPSAKEVKAAANQYRLFTPEEVRKLMAASPAGTRMGDLIRVALLTGCRLEEIAGLDATQVDPEARWYFMRKGKTDNATRYVPLVGIARDVILARVKKAKGNGPLFPDAPLRASTGKRGGALSQEFTRLRRDVLGEETDGELKQHIFRHVWRTMARRAGVVLDNALEMGGWSLPNRSDNPYDHGLELEQYCREQEKVAQWLRDKGYLGEVVANTEPEPHTEEAA